jgi:3-methyladenine DNA glycosylase Tag
MNTEGMIRSRRKIEAIRNARAVQPEFEYIWLPVAFSKNELQPDQD